jgi:hypothetical protein
LPKSSGVFKRDTEKIMSEYFAKVVNQIRNNNDDDPRDYYIEVEPKEYVEVVEK